MATVLSRLLNAFKTIPIQNSSQSGGATFKCTKVDIRGIRNMSTKLLDIGKQTLKT